VPFCATDGMVAEGPGVTPQKVLLNGSRLYPLDASVLKTIIWPPGAPARKYPGFWASAGLAVHRMDTVAKKNQDRLVTT